jgi:hypothetical protein
MPLKEIVFVDGKPEYGEGCLQIENQIKPTATVVLSRICLIAELESFPAKQLKLLSYLIC